MAKDYGPSVKGVAVQGADVPVTGASGKSADWVAVYNHKRSRQGEPLNGRRVRLDDGREGKVTRAIHRFVQKGGVVHVFVELDEKVFNEYPKGSGKGYWTHARWRGDLDDGCTLLAAPALVAPVRVRTVMARGSKEQIAQRWAALPPLSDEKRAEGYERYVEFRPDVAAYRRWRIVNIAPAFDQATVDATPDEAPGAASARRGRENDYDEPGYGY